MHSYGPPHMAEQKQDDQLEHTYNCSVRIQDVALKTCQKRWTIGRNGERESGISVLAARYHDDDDFAEGKRDCLCNNGLKSEWFTEKEQWKGFILGLLTWSGLLRWDIQETARHKNSTLVCPFCCVLLNFDSACSVFLFLIPRFILDSLHVCQRGYLVYFNFQFEQSWFIVEKPQKGFFVSCN